MTRTICLGRTCLTSCFIAVWLAGTLQGEVGYLYGIHDHAPQPTEYLNRIKAQVGGGWVTATVAVGHNPADNSGVDFSWYASQGHTVICRINNGYCEDGTIPLPDQYANFAQRCAKFVQNSPGCTIWLIGNETNLAGEWPPLNGHKSYVSPQNYADCFRACYDAIKAVRPTHKVICQAISPFGGPYGAGSVCGYTHDAVPINWVQYLNQMLTAIKTSGGIDGIALHINSRGYTYNDIHSTQQVNANGQNLYFSFYVYKDWINYGIPSDLYHLPLYATECNGTYYWSGGHPENPSSHYEAGWMQEIHAEIDRYNQSAAAVGKPLFRCINMYRWCNGCDGWNIDGSPYKSQILGDLDSALTLRYSWQMPGYEYIVESRSGGKNYAKYSEIGTFANMRNKSTAVGATPGIGARSASLNTSQGVNKSKYQFIAPMSGTYELFATWPSGSAGGSSVEHVVTHGAGSTSVVLNQTTGLNAWNSLGQFYMSEGATYSVTQTNENYPQPGFLLLADAVKWRFVSSGTPSSPVANFTANVTTGTVPLAVQFTDQSTGIISSWAWTFGDGQQSTQRNPQHVYAVPGTYTVVLTVTGPGGSNVRTRTNYITATAVPSCQLIHNANFSDGLNGWTKWTQRDNTGNFTASVSSGKLNCSGSDYNGGVYQQFSTGGAGKMIVLSGYWKSNPTVAGAQWGEIIVINGNRLPVDGVDETPGIKVDDVLIFKNDTWTTPAGWDGFMIDTAPVSHVGQFVAASDKATIILKSGNVGGAMTGLQADDLYVRFGGGVADFNVDGHVDSTDFDVFSGCYNGPTNLVAGECLKSDFNGDHYVDAVDFDVFSACYNGPTHPPGC